VSFIFAGTGFLSFEEASLATPALQSVKKIESARKQKPREPKLPGSIVFFGDNHYCAVAPLGLRFPGRKDLIVRSRSLFSGPYNTPIPINTISTIVEYVSTFVHSATPASSTAISVFSLAAGTAAAVFDASIV
jgi:hypothetical protein